MQRHRHSTSSDTAGDVIIPEETVKGNTRRGAGASVLQSSIAVLEMIDIKVAADEGNSLDMGDNEVLMILNGMNDNDIGAAGGDEGPFVLEIADILFSIASVVANSTVSSSLEKTHSSSLT